MVGLTEGSRQGRRRTSWTDNIYSWTQLKGSQLLMTVGYATDSNGVKSLVTAANHHQALMVPRDSVTVSMT